MSLGVFCLTVLRRARAIVVVVHMLSVQHSFSILPLMSRNTRDSGHASTSWFHKGWTPSTSKANPRKAAVLVGACRVLADSANNTEGVAMEGKEKTQGREKGTEEGGVAVRDTKENASEQESVKDFVVTEKRLLGIAPPPQQSERQV